MPSWRQPWLVLHIGGWGPGMERSLPTKLHKARTFELAEQEMETVLS